MKRLIQTKMKDLSGLKYGRLTVLELTRVDHLHRPFWRCKCDCGNFITANSGNLISGNSSSCGCKRKESLIQLAEQRITHGCSLSKEYYAWAAIKQRCYNPKHNAYKNYGGRGITVCERWLNSFDNFLADMGEAPSKNHSIDRINNEGNYEPENCRWATAKQQANNKRCSRTLQTTHAS